MKSKNSKRNFVQKLGFELINSRKIAGYFFLGIGFTMFILNITTILTIMQYYSGGYPLAGYYISILSSIILMTYSLYNIYIEE